MLSCDDLLTNEDNNQDILSGIISTAGKVDTGTKDPNKEWHITLYPADCRKLLKELSK